MPSGSSIGVFVAATFVFLLIPGPAVMFVVARSVSQGRRAGLVSVAGIHSGTLVHVAAAVLGLSAVLATSATAFTAVKLTGAAYLVYLGVKALVSRDGGGNDHNASIVRSNRRLFAEGFLVNLLNPKTAVFFLAFVPQFVEPGTGHATTQLLVLSTVFVAMGLATDGSYALAAGSLGARLRGRQRGVGRHARRASGVVYVALGLVTAFTGRHADA